MSGFRLPDKAVVRLMCFVFGHQYDVWQVFSSTSRRVVCHRCRRSWGMNDQVRAFIPWDRDIESMYELLGKIIRKWPTSIDRRQV